MSHYYNDCHAVNFYFYRFLHSVKYKLGTNLLKSVVISSCFLIGTVAIAALVGIGYALLFGLDASSIDLGSAEHSRGSEITKEAKNLTAHTLPQQILELLPSNPFLDFTGERTTSTIAVVIFASLLDCIFTRCT